MQIREEEGAPGEGNIRPQIRKIAAPALLIDCFVCHVPFVHHLVDTLLSVVLWLVVGLDVARYDRCRRVLVTGLLCLRRAVVSVSELEQ